MISSNTQRGFCVVVRVCQETPNYRMDMVWFNLHCFNNPCKTEMSNTGKKKGETEGDFWTSDRRRSKPLLSLILYSYYGP